MNRPMKIAILALTAVLIAAGCSRDNATAPAPAPSTTSGTAALTPETQSGLATMESALESPAWQSLDALRLTTSPAASAAGSVRPMLLSAAATPSVVTAATSSLVRDVAERLRQAVTSTEAKVIPASALGTTYVFDPQTHGYVADPSRTGAPANGVRYILYAVNPFTHEPVVSSEIGHADLTDEGDDAPNTAALRLVAVSNGVTFVDYRVSLAGENGSGELAVEGTFYDGKKHLTFVIHVLAQQTVEGESLDVRLRLAVPEDNFALTNEARAVAKDGTTRVNQAIALGDHHFVIASVHSVDAVVATVTVDGAVFAVIHWDASTLTVVGPDGEPLPLENRVALWRLLGLFDHVSRLLYRLLMPLNALFALIPQA
jgi:hypothetical protein